MKWRVGRSVPLNVYEGDRPICQCHNEQDAQRIVEAFAAVERLEAKTRIFGEVKLCATCGGSGVLPGGTAEYPAGGCCPIGHAKDCECRLCEWRRAFYREENAGNVLRQQLQRLEVERQAVSESAAITARRIVTAWIDPKPYKLQPEHEQELQAAIAAALAERQSDTARLDWLEAQGDFVRIEVDPDLEGGVKLSSNAFTGLTLRAAIDAAIESTKEPANG